MLSTRELPGEVLLIINEHLSLAKDKAHPASVNHHWHTFFQPEIEKQVAKEAAEYAIYPTEENVEKLKILLKDCPALLLHPMKIKNRHGQVIHGTVYQIALHECDDELINDEIKPAFERLPNGLEKMEAQHQAWLPEGWMEAEEEICASVLAAIDNLFATFRNASNRNDVIELGNYPLTKITINHQGAQEALRTYSKAIDALYMPTNEVIDRGLDPSIRLLKRIIDQYEENFNALGGFNQPRNNALLRKCFGYGQRFAPINLMQVFAQGPYCLIKKKERLTRVFKWRTGNVKPILPLDSDPEFRLGHDYCANGGAVVEGNFQDEDFKNFFNQKLQQFSSRTLCKLEK